MRTLTHRSPLLLAAWVAGASAFATEGTDSLAARQAMARATGFMRSIAAEGGYLWRYSADLSVVAGEERATRTSIEIQPPGTPSMGMAFLRAYAATGERVHLDAARDAARALARSQLESGGWPYSIDFAPDRLRRFYRRGDVGTIAPAEVAARNNVSTYDDDNSQSALRFLMSVDSVLASDAGGRDLEIAGAMNYGLRKLIEAQYPNGAWPQRYDGRLRNPEDHPVRKAVVPEDWPRELPPRHNYGFLYTLNDNTLRDCILTMVEARKRLGGGEYLEAAKRGGDFILFAQLPAPQAGWAQQYSFSMEPAWARAFEPAAVCSAESAGVIQTLMDLHLATGEAKYLEPIPAAVEWIKGSEIRPGVWARFYELGTNRPIYGDRDGRIHYTLEEISEERRRGYAWEGGFGVRAAMDRYEALVKEGRAAVLERGAAREADARERERRRRQLAPRVREIIDALDSEGRWLVKGRMETRGMVFEERIETSLFIRNMQTLSDYVSASGRE